ncbi:MAG: gamma-glutamyl-gamma-aminobutyrate hydrolase family protein [Omnitrophica WOR_2 bacterium]
MQSPVIGLTAWRLVNRPGSPAISLSESYIRSVVDAGGIPVILPLGLTAQDIRKIVARVDGILFTGGGDIHPRFYHAAENPLITDINEQRDQEELQIFEAAIQDGKPFLGICRGIQLVNVAAGGSLYADVETELPGALRHDCHQEPSRGYLAHEVTVVENSRLAEILGNTRVKVNSLHHQAVRDVAPVFKPVAHTSDGLVEAVEMQDYPYGLAVQWHPEDLQKHAPMRLLFRSLVDAAAGLQDPR